MISVDQGQLERAVLLLNRIPKGAERAISGALNRGLSSARTAASKEIRDTYYIKQTDLYSGNGIKINRATPNNTIGEIDFAGSVIPLIRFNVKDKNSRSKGHVAAAVLKKNNPKALKGNFEHSGAFVATMKSGHEGLWQRELGARTSYGKERLKELFGPAIAHMADNPKVRLAMEDAAKETIDNRLEQEIHRLLEGYGGLL